jgi:hypothetical protein
MEAMTTPGSHSIGFDAVHSVFSGILPTGPANTADSLTETHSTR